MYHYLKRLPGLTLQSAAVNATSLADMKELFSTMKSKVVGCFILTADIRDKTFQNLATEDFTSGFSSKSGVLEILKDTVDITTLDFVVAFSSVSGTFGFGGQTNYGAYVLYSYFRPLAISHSTHKQGQHSFRGVHVNCCQWFLVYLPRYLGYLPCVSCGGRSQRSSFTPLYPMVNHSRRCACNSSYEMNSSKAE